MKTLLIVPALALSLGLAACGGGEKNEVVANETVELNADEGAVIGNDAILPPGNEVAPLNASEDTFANASGNTL